MKGNSEQITRAAAIIGAAELVVVSTGAGMSQESGIPTFRDSQSGLWARFNPEELATEAAFRRNPQRVWKWYEERRTAMERCTPHAGHRALVDLEGRVDELCVITQNIDGLHQRAGSAEVIELHGAIHRCKCLECGDAFTPENQSDAEEIVDGPPTCSSCSGPIRPDVVWFGETLPTSAVERAWALADGCDVMLVIGTSGVVWPAAELPLLAKRGGATLIEISPESTELTHAVDVFLQGPAGEILPQLVAVL